MTGIRQKSNRNGKRNIAPSTSKNLPALAFGPLTFRIQGQGQRWNRGKDQNRCRTPKYRVSLRPLKSVRMLQAKFAEGAAQQALIALTIPCKVSEFRHGVPFFELTFRQTEMVTECEQSPSKSGPLSIGPLTREDADGSTTIVLHTILECGERIHDGNRP